MYDEKLREGEVELEFGDHLKPRGDDQYDPYSFDDSEFGDYDYGDEYDDNDLYYDEEDDYGDYYSDEYDEEDDLPHPNYQKGFFKNDSPINRFMSDRNTSYKKKEGPVKNHSNDGQFNKKFNDLNSLKNLNNKKSKSNNPYYKLLDWSMPDLHIDVT